MARKNKQIPEKKIFDLGIAWNWAFDKDFVYQLNDSCLQRGLSPYLVFPDNLYETLRLIREDKIGFRCFFDRATDTDHRFYELIELLQDEGTEFINHPDRIKWINDKALIHMDFFINKLPVPETFIYYPTDDRRTILNKIKQVGIPFVIKPAHGVEMGGLGVLVSAKSIDDLYNWHNRYRNFVFLLQRQVNHCLLGKKPAYFRIYHVLGKIIPMWWDPLTHAYEAVTDDDVSRYKLKPLYTLTEKITKLYQMCFFSTEIAVEKGRKYFIVDYINDQCDMRRKSKYKDGVSDEIVDKVVDSLLNGVVQKIKHLKKQ